TSESSNYDIFESKIVTGVHFSPEESEESEKSACGMEKNKALFSDIAKKLILVNKEDKELLNSLLEECFPLFMSIFNNCKHHGFINITPKFPIYLTLNRTDNSSSEFRGHISILSMKYKSLPEISRISL
ncbi:10690_t:CDS:2, partial [Scutellospora calospora]